MKKIYISICLMLVSVIGFPQWVSINSGTNSSLNSVCFTDENTGYIVGSDGVILKTTDGGYNWTSLTSGTTQGLAGVYFFNENIGYAVGTHGTIIKTTNSGNNWFSQNSGTVFVLQEIFFSDILTGYAVGDYNTLLKTTNEGNDWSISTIGGTYNSIWDVFFTGANTGYLAAWASSLFKGVVFKTTDGGINWSEYLTGYDRYLRSIHFPTTNTGYAVGYRGAVYRTKDAGSSWTSINSSFNYDIFSVYFTDVDNGYIACYSGAILKTTNSGTNWSLQYNNYGFSLYDIFFTNGNNGFAVGSSGIILKTTNGGGSFISEFQLNESAYNIYPNPSTNIITIANDGALQKETIISIFNIRGEEVFSNTFNNQNSMDIDVSSFAKGIYMVKIQSEEGFAVKKLIIQ